jgi:NAD(P)-dependent dehydrogenase (short-subunit alcohol dehydrogenase family)
MRRDHVSIIVGGSRGIGQAIARALAARGGNVFVIGRNRERIDTTLQDLKTLGAGRHVGRVLDAAVPDDMSQMAAVCLEMFGRADLLVFSAVVAGYEEVTRLPPQVLDLPAVAWRKAIDVNLNGAFLANKAVLPLMIRQGDGDIINIASALTRYGMRGSAHAAAYSATKYALAAFTHCLASEVSEHGVRVNAIFPGTVATPLIDSTALASRFGGQIAAEHLALALIGLLEFSAHCTPVDPYILPMPGSGLSFQVGGARDGPSA